MVGVDMSIPESMDKISGFQVTHLGYHHSQQRIRRYVERHSEKGVGTSLLQLTRQFAILHIKLKHGMTWRQGHLLDICHVPGTYNQPS